MSKKLISILLAVVLLASMAAVAVANVSAAEQKGDYMCKKYYFYIPDRWMGLDGETGEVTDEFKDANVTFEAVHIYWWSVAEELIPDGWPGIPAEPTKDPNVWYAWVPEGVPVIIFNNGIDAGEDVNAPLFKCGYQTYDHGAENYSAGYEDPDEPLDSIPPEQEDYPDGIDDFDGMILVPSSEKVGGALSPVQKYVPQWYYLYDENPYNYSWGITPNPADSPATTNGYPYCPEGKGGTGRVKTAPPATTLPPATTTGYITLPADKLGSSAKVDLHTGDKVYVDYVITNNNPKYHIENFQLDFHYDPTLLSITPVKKANFPADASGIIINDIPGFVSANASVVYNPDAESEGIDFTGGKTLIKLELTALKDVSTELKLYIKLMSGVIEGQSGSVNLIKDNEVQNVENVIVPNFVDSVTVDCVKSSGGTTPPTTTTPVAITTVKSGDTTVKATDNNENSTSAQSSSGKSDDKSVKTGASVATIALFLVLVAAAGAIVIVRKKAKN